MKKYTACLDIGFMQLKYVETPEGDWIDDPEDLTSFRLDFVGDLVELCRTNLTVLFDGDLDSPELYEKIEAAWLYGPRSAEYNEGGLAISRASFYFNVEAREELTEDQLEDLVHVIEPCLSYGGYVMAFGDFQEFTVSFEDIPDEGTALKSEWTNYG